MSEESNCVRCNKHPKKAGESVCKVCYDAGSGYFDMVGNDLADYFEWPEDGDFGAETQTFEARYNQDGTIVLTDAEWNRSLLLHNGNYLLWGMELNSIGTLKGGEKFEVVAEYDSKELAGIYKYERILKDALSRARLRHREELRRLNNNVKHLRAEEFEAEGFPKRMKCRTCKNWEYIRGVAMNDFTPDDEGKWRCRECFYDKPNHKVVTLGRGSSKPFEAEGETMNEELMEAIMIVFLKNNIRDEKEQLKELMFIYGALEEQMYRGGAESFGAEDLEWWMELKNSCGNNDCGDGHCPNCGSCRGWAMDEDDEGNKTGMNYCGSCSHRFYAESFGATKGMDTYAQPFSELKIKPTKTKVGILLTTIVAGGLWYAKKMKEE